MNEEILEMLVDAIQAQAARDVRQSLALTRDTITQYEKRNGRAAKEQLILDSARLVIQDMVEPRQP